MDSQTVYKLWLLFLQYFILAKQIRYYASLKQTQTAQSIIKLIFNSINANIKRQFKIAEYFWWMVMFSYGNYHKELFWGRRSRGKWDYIMKFATLSLYNFALVNNFLTVAVISFFKSANWWFKVLARGYVKCLSYVNLISSTQKT